MTYHQVAVLGLGTVGTAEIDHEKSPAVHEVGLGPSLPYKVASYILKGSTFSVMEKNLIDTRRNQRLTLKSMKKLFNSCKT